MVFLSLLLAGVPLDAFGQAITIKPNETKHTVSSHIIGTQRNHTYNEVDTTLQNGQDRFFYDKLNLYSEITPSFGNGRKIYRLGGTDIDGWHNLDYPGYHWATDYGKGNLNWLLSPPSSSKVTSPSSPSYWGEAEGTKELGAGVHRILYQAPTGEFSGFTVTVNYPETIDLASINCPNIYTTNLSNNVTWQDPTAISSCGSVEVYQTSGPASGSNNFPIGIREIDYRFTDDCGAVSYCSFLVVVNDANLMNNNTISKINSSLQDNMMVTLPDVNTHNIAVTWNNHEYKEQNAPQYYVPNYDNLSYYLDDAEKMNADLSVGINVASGHPHEAAGLVQHLINTGNIDKVAYFELGNEISLSPVWGGPKGHPCTPESYASFAAQFVRAMRAVKPDIRIAAMGSYNHDWSWDGWGYDDINCTASSDWAHEIDVFLETFVDDATIDFVAYHGYSTYNIFPVSTEHTFTTIDTTIVGTDTTYTTIVNIAYADCDGGVFSDAEAAKHLFALNEWAKQPGSPLHEIQDTLLDHNIQLVNSEYFTHMSAQARPNLAHSITESIFTAENMMLAFSENIRAAVNFSFHQTLWNDPSSQGSHNLFFDYDTLLPKTIFWTHKLIAENMGDTVIASIANFDSVSIMGCHGGQQYNYPEVGEVTTVGDSGIIQTLIINRSPINYFGAKAIKVVVENNRDYFAELISIIGGNSFVNQSPIIPDFENATKGYDCVSTLDSVPIEGLSINVLRLTPVDTEFDVDMTCTTVNFKGPEDNPSNYSYVWNFGDGASSNELNPIHTYTTPGTYMLSLNVSSPNGCTIQVLDTIDITVEPIDANFTSAISCQVVSFTGPTDTNIDSYSWDFGDNNGTSVLQNPAYTYSSNGIYFVSLTIKDNCDIEITLIDTIEINCNPSFTCPCTGNNAINIDAGSGTLLSTVPQLAGNGLNNTCLSISGKLVIDKDFTIYFGEIKMQPKSEIIVKSGNKFRLGWVAQNDGIHGCEQMWKGITVEDNASLMLTSTLIKDAQYAIKALNNSNLALANNTFDRNYVGIYTPIVNGNGFEQTINHIYAMYGNTFTCAGNNCQLLPGYSGQVPQPGNLPFAGIEINNAIFSVGKNNPYATNYFSNMHNGIVGYKSFVVSYYSEIQNMHQLPASQGYKDGCGIKSKNSFIVSDHSTINHARIGIESLSDYYVQSKYDVLSNTLIGAEIRDTWFSPAIEDDTIKDFTYAGIDLSYPKYQLSSSIQRNYLQAERYFGMKFTGIPYGKKLSYNEITDNRIIIDSIGTGIEVYSSGRLGIQDNSILLSSPVDTFSNGIRLFDARYNYIHGDTLLRTATAATAELDGIGLRVVQSPNNTICNNITKGWELGNFFANGCANTSFKFNEIGANARGVWVNPSSNIGKQTHHVNAWTDGYRSAYNLDLNPTIRKLSQFQINTCDAPKWPDYIYPTQGCETSTSDDWFVLNNDVPVISCDPIFNFRDNPPTEEIIRENDISLVNGAFKNTQYGEMLDWEQSRYLYRKMYNQENLIGVNYQTDAFFYDNEDSPLGMLVEIEEMINEAYSIPYDYYSNWGEHTDTLLSILHEIGRLEAQLDSTTNMQDSLILTAQRSTQYTNIQEVATNLSAKAASMDALKAPIITEIALKNYAIQPQTEIEGLEKTLNTIYLGVVSGKTQLNATEQETVRAIANRCPMQYGHVVLKARAIRSLFEQVISYDDERLCDEVESRSYRQRNPIEQVSSFEIQPNPAYDLLQVSWKKQPQRGEKVRFEIRSLEGFLMDSWNLDEKANGNYLDISAIQSGFYIARIFIGTDMETKKVIILR